MTSSRIDDAIAQSRRAPQAAAPEFDAVLRYRRPRHRLRTAPLAMTALLAAGALFALPMLSPPPSAEPDYAVTLPRFTASLAAAAEPVRLPSLASLTPKGDIDASH